MYENNFDFILKAIAKAKSRFFVSSFYFILFFIRWHQIMFLCHFFKVMILT